MKKLPVIVLPIVILVTFIAVGVVEAQCYGKAKSSSIVGIPTISTKTDCFGVNTWNPIVSSSANSSVGRIGFTWWSVQVICTPPGGGTPAYPINNYLTDKHNLNATWYSNQYLIPLSYTQCPGGWTREYGNFGNHEYTVGSNHDYPRVDYYWP